MPKPPLNSEALIAKIKSRNFQVAIIGLGYVGLPLAIEFARSGIKTCGIDVNAKKNKEFASWTLIYSRRG